MAEDFKNLINKEDLDEYHKGAKKTFAAGEHEHAPLTIHDAVGGDKTYDGTEPVDVMALKGEDGYSPTIDVSEETGKHTLTIKDKNGTKTVEILDGAGGDSVVEDITGTLSSSEFKYAQWVMSNGINNKATWYTPMENTFVVTKNGSKTTYYEQRMTLDAYGYTIVKSDSDGSNDVKGLGTCAVVRLRVPYNTSAIRDATSRYSGVVAPILRSYVFDSVTSDIGKKFTIYEPFINNGSASFNKHELNIPSKEWIEAQIENAGGGGSSSIELFYGSETLSDGSEKSITLSDYDGSLYSQFGGAAKEHHKFELTFKAGDMQVVRYFYDDPMTMGGTNYIEGVNGSRILVEMDYGSPKAMKLTYNQGSSDVSSLELIEIKQVS